MSNPRQPLHRPCGNPAAVFAALGDDTRLWLVNQLCDGQPRSIASLSSGTPLTRQAVTKHLRVLQDAGLVASERCGREVHFALEREAVEQARAYLDQVSAQWDHALGRLERFLDGHR